MLSDEDATFSFSLSRSKNTEQDADENPERILGKLTPPEILYGIAYDMLCGGMWYLQGIGARI
jgi:hypothetical protein